MEMKTYLFNFLEFSHFYKDDIQFIVCFLKVYLGKMEMKQLFE